MDEAKCFRGKIKNISKNLWFKKERGGNVKETKNEKDALCFFDEADAEATMQMLNDCRESCYTLVVDDEAEEDGVKNMQPAPLLIKAYLAAFLSLFVFFLVACMLGLFWHPFYSFLGCLCCIGNVVVSLLALRNWKSVGKRKGSETSED